jgi:hypothetical protein
MVLHYPFRNSPLKGLKLQITMSQSGRKHQVRQLIWARSVAASEFSKSAVFEIGTFDLAGAVFKTGITVTAPLLCLILLSHRLILSYFAYATSDCVRLQVIQLNKLPPHSS